MSWKLPSKPREDKHNFFRAGNVSRKKGTSINISYTTHERNNLQGKNFNVLFPSYSQNILNEKFNPYMNTIRVVFSVIKTFLQFSIKGRGDPPPLASRAPGRGWYQCFLCREVPFFPISFLYSQRLLTYMFKTRGILFGTMSNTYNAMFRKNIWRLKALLSRKKIIYIFDRVLDMLLKANNKNS